MAFRSGLLKVLLVFEREFVQHRGSLPFYRNGTEHVPSLVSLCNRHLSNRQIPCVIPTYNWRQEVIAGVIKN